VPAVDPAPLQADHGIDEVEPVESELPEALEAIFASQDERVYSSHPR
jgi:hypothetical protein